MLRVGILDVFWPRFVGVFQCMKLVILLRRRKCKTASTTTFTTERQHNTTAQRLQLPPSKFECHHFLPPIHSNSWVMKSPVVRPIAMEGQTREGNLQTLIRHNGPFHAPYLPRGRESLLTGPHHLWKGEGGNRREQMPFLWSCSHSLTNVERVP